MPLEDEARQRTPRRFRTLRPNPLRDVLPWVVVAVGAVQSARGIATLSTGGSPGPLLVGIGLVVLGVAVSCVDRWQARRGR